MKLHSLHIICFMLQCHDIIILISCCYFQFFRKIFIDYDPAMITTYFDFIRQPFK